jgi:hypothetical protein
MSSPAVRDAINQAVAALAAPWPTFDMSNYQTLDEVLAAIDAEAVLIQYVVADDQLQTIGGEGNQGYEETGVAVVHLVVPTGFPSGPTVAKGFTIQTGMRGRRLSSDITIQSMSPFTDFGAGSIGVTGAVHGFAASLFYVNRTCG